jgi:hypothetical protein
LASIPPFRGPKRLPSQTTTITVSPSSNIIEQNVAQGLFEQQPKEEIKDLNVGVSKQQHQQQQETLPFPSSQGQAPAQQLTTQQQMTTTQQQTAQQQQTTAQPQTTQHQTTTQHQAAAAVPIFGHEHLALGNQMILKIPLYNQNRNKFLGVFFF